ncbi:MAG: T9SS type A sorting domain-containing protein [Bacteroidota bacterium]
MKKIIFLLALIITIHVQAQDAIKKVIVETYYISDANDASDTTGGMLEVGSKTYRIYIQMTPGCKLKKIYGDVNHALKISSTENFFNNTDRGKSFGKDINKNYYQNNTTAVDSWLTIGQTTKNGSPTYFGVLKSLDNNGSFIGGVYNDKGLLTNNTSAMGLPLTVADGMDTMSAIPSNWLDNGFVDLVSGVDSTIFGSAKAGNEFNSNNAYLQNSGVSGVFPDSNQVLVAQLTTKGDISFELNVELLNPNGSTTSKYVAVQGSDSLDTHHSGWLKYPFECGCTDPNYFEYSSEYACSDQSACHTKIVFGCMDPLSCNYNPLANFNLTSLCCYPGNCGDRDISLVCPLLPQEKAMRMNLFPSPASNQITIQANVNDYQDARIVVYNSFGKIEFENKLGSVTGDITHDLNISKLEQGIYMVRMYIGNSVLNKTFIKL